MAKGRKLTISRSDRLLGSYGYGQGTVTEASELGEDDVWSMVDGMVNGVDHHRYNDSMMNGSQGDCKPPAVAESNGNLSIRSCRRGGHRDDSHAGGLSLAFEESGKTASSRIVHQLRGQDSVASPRGRHVANSAPVNVPDWSKIYRVDSVESLNESDYGVDEDDDDGSNMVPPHEYLAREYRKMAANSVFEGVGRTLKGRDMSRVRDAVWGQTGFYG